MTLEAEKKSTILRRLILAIIIFVLSFMQSGDGRFPQFFGIRALLVIPVLVAVSMYERDVSGIFFGIFAGALCDIFAAGNNFNAIYFVIVGFVCGTLMNTIMRNNIFTHLLLSSAFCFVYNLIYWLYHFVFAGLDRSIFMFFRYYLTSTIYSVILSPLAFIIIRIIEKKFRPELF